MAVPRLLTLVSPMCLITPTYSVPTVDLLCMLHLKLSEGVPTEVQRQIVGNFFYLIHVHQTHSLIFRSLGVLLYTLVYGAMPFDGSNFKRLVKQITTGDYHEPIPSCK